MTSRYSFIGVNPSIVIEGKGDKVKIAEGNDIRILNGNPLEVVKSILKNREMTGIPGLPPFTGGAVGYLGYDMVHNFEKLPRHAADDLGLPDLVMMFSDIVVAFGAGGL